MLHCDFFKKIIIVFWTLWWLIALWTDIVGGLAHLHILNASWAPDINYPFLAGTLKMYHVPAWLVTSFFIGILVWSLLSSYFFCWASLGLRQSKEVWLRRANVAFIVSLTYWLAFFLADQVVMKFDLEANHMIQGSFQLLSYLALFILPWDTAEK